MPTLASPARPPSASKPATMAWATRQHGALGGLEVVLRVRSQVAYVDDAILLDSSQVQGPAAPLRGHGCHLQSAGARVRRRG